MSDAGTECIVANNLTSQISTTITTSITPNEDDFINFVEGHSTSENENRNPTDGHDDEYQFGIVGDNSEIPTKIPEDTSVQLFYGQDDIVNLESGYNDFTDTDDNVISLSLFDHEYNSGTSLPVETPSVTEMPLPAQPPTLTFNREAIENNTSMLFGSNQGKVNNYSSITRNIGDDDNMFFYYKILDV